MLREMEFLKQEGRRLHELCYPPDAIRSVLHEHIELIDFGTEKSIRETLEKAVKGLSESRAYTEEEGYLHYLPADVVKKYFIRISFQGLHPTIWRKVEVPSNITLPFLMDIITATMGWEKYAQTDYGHRTYTDRLTKQVIADLLHTKGEFCHLLYSTMEEEWQLQITLSGIGDYTDGEPKGIRLVSGKNACPPEGCGGIDGYKALCHYYYTQEWDKKYGKHFYNHFVNKQFNPEYFPLKETQQEVDKKNYPALIFD